MNRPEIAFRLPTRLLLEDRRAHRMSTRVGAKPEWMRRLRRYVVLYKQVCTFLRRCVLQT
jgi:hypothetical protein